MKKIYCLVITLLSAVVFSNAQIIQSFPHIEDFEAQANCPGSCNAACNFTNGWLNETGDDGNWITDNGGTSSGSTGPSIDHTLKTTTGKYLYFETSSPCYPNRVANLRTPQIDLSGTNAVQFEFWWHMYGATQGTLGVWVSNNNGATYTQVWGDTTDNQDLWQKGTVDLSSYTGDTIYVRFRGVSTSSHTSDMAIDDIRIYDLLPIDAGVTSIDTPSTPYCTLPPSSNVHATIQNFGTDTLFSTDIAWEVNGTPQTTYSWSGMLLQNQKVSVNIGSAAIVPNDIIKAWTTNPNMTNEFASGAGNDTISQNVGAPALNGTYTLGGGLANFPTFDSAITALNTYGVCGPVVINVNPGQYNERVSIGNIAGSSATNTVTFDGLNRDSVLLWDGTSTSVANYVVELNGATYITFRNMGIRNTSPTYKYVVHFSGPSDFITFDNNYLYNDSTYTTTSTNSCIVYSGTSSENTRLTFTNNVLVGGSYGFYMYGTSTTSLSDFLRIEGNTIKPGYYGMRLYYQNAPKVRNNVIDMSYSSYTGTMYAIYEQYCDNASEITGNIINSLRSQASYGIYLGNNDGTSINKGLIANNMIAVGDTNSTSTNYGIYLTNTGHQNIYNNSINDLNNGTNSRGVYITGGGLINFVNNNISGFNGYNFYLNSSFAITESDHNNFYNKNGNVGYFNANQATLAAWQSASGFDANSLSADPQFYAPNDLHTCAAALDGAGKVLSLVTMDIDGNTRNTSTPDIGADEFAAMVGSFLGPDTAICAGDSITIGVFVPGTYLWTPTGDTTGTITVGPGTYSVISSTVCGSGTDAITINTLPSPTASFNAAQSFLTYTFTNTSTNATSYYWDFGDGTNSTATNPLPHVYPTDSTYTVTLIAYGDCGNDTTTMQVTPNTVGLDEFAFTNGVVISPNPNNGQFAVSLTLTDNESVKMEVIDIAGKLVYTENLSGKEGQNTVNVNLANAKGVYFVKLTSKLGTAIERVVIK